MIQKPVSYLNFFLILSLGLLLVAAVDRGVALIFGDHTLAPLVSLLVLAGFSFFLTPNQIMASIPFFALESYFLIREASAYPYVRTATVFFGGGLAWAVCIERRNISNKLFEIDTILSQLPTPWLMVDSSGNILQASHMAISALGLTLPEIQASSFSYLFFPNEKKGDFIQTFLKVVDRHQGVSGLELICRHSGCSYYASLAPLSSSRGTSVLVVLTPKIPL
ncbi:MAG: hypothetical protein EBZ78_12840 [Verrucomicrobia bacterium]|nr:hypothetical protein [Verrucomicrobiota bacterium]